MTSDLCTEDVVVHITTPQIITTQSAAAAAAAAAGGAGARVAASSAAVELGRRLLLAARAGDTQLVLDLLAKGAPFTTDWLGTSPLHLAASNAHADTCAVLLRAGVSRDARSKVERTPLHVAAAAGHERVARLLLDAGAAADARDMLRMTPLHWAVQRGHAGVARELLRRGADPLLLSKFHKSARSLAQELRRDDLVRLVDDALKQREAARSVSALVNEQMAETTTEPSTETFEAVQRIQDTKPKKPKPPEKTVKPEQNNECESAAAGGSAAAQLLRKHGITLLPTDDGSTVLNALQSGRTVVLSDAGKLMLKESGSAAAGGGGAGVCKAGVVLTATPVKSPPSGVKIFTLNNKLLAVPKDNKIPVKKVINPQDMQVKFVQLPPDAKIVSPSKLVPMKAKNRLAGRAATPAITSLGGQRSSLTSLSGQRPAVKIIMNKSNFNRLMSTARPAELQVPELTMNNEVESEETTEGEVEMVGNSDSPAVLRAQLAAAQRALVALRRELKSTRARLAHYERLHSQ